MEFIIETLTLVAVLFFNACSEKETLQGKNFVMDGNKNITISFDAKDNKFYGKAINNYFGTYKTDNNNITIDKLITVIPLFI